MDQRLVDLLKQFDLERLEVNLFRGESRDIGSPQVFGGQVLGQAMRAAYATIEGRVAHSLQAYFLRRGDFNAPIVYTVDRSRDGASFATRRVTAIQHGEQIFNCAVSFQRPEEGLDHQMAMPAVVGPEGLPDAIRPPPEVIERLPAKLQAFFLRERPFEFRSVQQVDYLQPRALAAERQIWFRTVDRCPDDDVLHRCLLAYVSDYSLLEVATLPHWDEYGRGGHFMLASLDHAMWFHRPLRVDEWLLYTMDSPSASGARAFTRGSIFARDGRLVASTAQEGLMRLIDPARIGALK